ncbi:hypothetical protein GY45DRAFT_1315220 [Cubamyces sp. BRFM 1775]|nr:hypothetical protein GY45DRAFT_1315220 [Cubamyces sp. BRFM 1775]
MRPLRTQPITSWVAIKLYLRVATKDSTASCGAHWLDRPRPSLDRSSALTGRLRERSGAMRTVCLFDCLPVFQPASPTSRAKSTLSCRLDIRQGNGYFPPGGWRVCDQHVTVSPSTPAQLHFAHARATDHPHLLHAIRPVSHIADPPHRPQLRSLGGSSRYATNAPNGSRARRIQYHCCPRCGPGPLLLSVGGDLQGRADWPTECKVQPSAAFARDAIASRT